MKKLSFLCFVMLLCISMLAGCASEEPLFRQIAVPQRAAGQSLSRCSHRKQTTVSQKRIQMNLALLLPVRRPYI